MLSFLDIFWRPGAVFDRVRRRGTWATPLVATVFLTFVGTYLLVSMAGMELITLQRFQNDQGLAERVGEDSVDKAVNGSNSRVPKMVYLSRAGGYMFAAILGLAAVLAVTAALMDAEPRVGYSQMLGTVSYAFFPFALLNTIATWIILARDSDHSGMDLENLTGINLGRVLDRASANPPLFELAVGLDLVGLAQVVFLAFGFSRTADLPFMRCLVICLAFWAVFILWKAALAAFF